MATIMAQKRLIDVDAFVKAVGDHIGNTIIGKTLIGLLNNAPTIDAVEVVRCKDCLNCGMKAAIKYDGYRDDVRLCMLHGIPVLPDDYCSGGVKMDAEVEGCCSILSSCATTAASLTYAQKVEKMQ